MTDQLARAGNDICVYHHAVEDPGLPLDTMFRLRVVRGYISYSGFRYKNLCGLNDLYVPDPSRMGDMQGDAPILSVRTVIQETNVETRLEMAYLFDYLDQDCKRKTRWLHLPFLFRKLQSRTRNNICPSGCDGVYKPVHNWPPANQAYPQRSFKFEDDSVEKARQLLKSLSSPVDAWLLHNQPRSINIIIGQPLLLYTLVAQSSICLAPFTDCFKCIVENFTLEGYLWAEGRSVVLLTSTKAMMRLPIIKIGDEALDGDTSSEPCSPMIGDEALDGDTSSESCSPMEVS